MNFKYKVGDKVKIKSLDNCKKILYYEPFFLDSSNYAHVLKIQNKYEYFTISECFNSRGFNCYHVEGTTYGFLENWLKPITKDKIKNILNR